MSKGPERVQRCNRKETALGAGLAPASGVRSERVV